MKAVVKYDKGPGNVGLREMPEPELRPGHVLVEVEAAGICGTDLHIQAGEYPCNPPVILGHEFSGTVVEAAPDVETVRPGRRITCLPYFSTCGACDSCRAGLWNLCPQRRSVGSGTHGAFARYVLVPERSVRFLPAEVDFVAGAVTEPLACCTHALLEKATIRPSEVVAVLGPGSIGLLAAQVALACGATVVVAGTSGDEARMELALRLGVHHTVDVATQSAAGVLNDLTGGRGADVVVECSGSAAAARLGYQLVKRRGQFVQIGLFGRPVELDPDLAVIKEVEIRNSFASTETSWDCALQLMEQGRVHTRLLVTDALPLEQWEEGFNHFRSKQSIKVVLLPKF